MTFDWSIYRGSKLWLPERTIFLTRHGSHAYGTNIETSDLDMKGVCVAPVNHYLGFQTTFEQAEQNEPVDLVVFEISKFMKLASGCNPNVIEILFTDKSDHLVTHPVMERLLATKNQFLSRQAYFRFVNYALDQLRRIDTHRKWLLDPPKAPPERADFGLPNQGFIIPKNQLDAVFASVRKQLDTWAWKDLDGLDPVDRLIVKAAFEDRLVDIVKWHYGDLGDKLWLSAVKNLGFDTNFIELLDKERRYKASMDNWDKYQMWVKKRNPARAALEAAAGFDTKHGLHLVRLMRMGREILTRGEVLVRRPDAAELLGIRRGEWSYDKIKGWAEQEKLALKEAMEKSLLPKEADVEALDRLCIELVSEFCGFPY
jgi:predicted nucleotidyltransferase